MHFDTDGAQHFPGAFSDGDLIALASVLIGLAPRGVPGIRLKPGQMQRSLIAAADAIATSILGVQARPVAAKFFDKSSERNWSLGWHQDRTIAVRDQRNVPGFSAWTIKSGIHHCEPAFDVLARMLTLRIHLDSTGLDNAPLLVAPGSHRCRGGEDETALAVTRFGTATCLAEPGDVWAYALPILHASDRSERPARRRVLQISYSAGELPGGIQWLGV